MTPADAKRVGLADVALALSYYISKRDNELNNHERVIIAALTEFPGLRSAVADHEMLCGAAMAEIRKLCNEIMGGNCAFIDDDFGRALVTMRDQRDAAVNAHERLVERVAAMQSVVNAASILEQSVNSETQGSEEHYEAQLALCAAVAAYRLALAPTSAGAEGASCG